MPTWILMDWFMREVIEMELHPNLTNGEKAWFCSGHGNLSFTPRGTEKPSA